MNRLSGRPRFVPLSKLDGATPTLSAIVIKTVALTVVLVMCPALLVVPAVTQAAAMACGGFRTEGYGPFDYRTRKDKLAMVEGFHFTPEVEMLVRGKSSADIGEDIDYTLDVFPNHHRALVSMMRLIERTKMPQPPGAHYTMDCYFDRAMRYAPTDEVARLLYANYLVKANRNGEAQVQLDRVEVLAEDNAFTHFNLGLVYLEMKDYDKALIQAHLAQSLGLQKTELMDALKKDGKWRDAALPGEASSSPASAQAPASATAGNP
jgi:hypothetical protein